VDPTLVLVALAGAPLVQWARDAGLTVVGEAFADRAITVPECPLCGAEMSIQKWVNQGDQRYMTMAKCPEHGSELVRLKFHRAEDGSYSVTRLIYEADEAMEGFFEAKATQPRRRGKRHSRCKGGRQQ